MLVTKKEVKQTSKKLLSVLLAVIMVMTSMSVCFGTFVTASAEDTDYMTQLADKLKDSAYSSTISAIAGTANGGSNQDRTSTCTFASYKNFKQAAELLRLTDLAMRETASYKKADTFSNSTDTTDQKSACNGANFLDVYNDFCKDLEKKQVTVNTTVTGYLKFIFAINANANGINGATLHSTPASSKKGEWKNTVTFSTTDYKGYLAQAGKAANVPASVEMGVEYVLRMNGDLFYKDGCNSKYHHQIWPKSMAISAPSTNSSNTEMKTKLNSHITELNSFIGLTYDQLLEKANAGTLDSTLTDYENKKNAAVTYVGSDATYAALFADYQTGINNFLTSAASAKEFQTYLPTVDAWNDFVDNNPDYGVFQYDNFGPAGSASQVKLLEDFATFKAYRDYLLSGGSIYTYLVNNNYIDEAYYTNFYDNVVAYDLQASKDKADALYTKYSVSFPAIDVEEPGLEEKQIVYSELCGYINAIGAYSQQVVKAVYYDGYTYLVDLRESLKCDINESVLYFAENADKTFTTISTTNIWAMIDEARSHRSALDALYNDVKANVGSARADELLNHIKNSATMMVENLYRTLADRFTGEVNNAWDVYVELGKPTALKVDSFLKLSSVMVAIEPDILSGLQTAGKAGYVSQTTIDRYNELMKVGGIYEIWNAYASTFGFPDYKQTTLQYADRQPYENDMVKTGSDPVTKDEMKNLIVALDKIIGSDLVGDLLGGLLNPDADENADTDFDLGAMLTELIKGALFTDDFINTVVQMLYPLVLGEFDKVWATLPNSVDHDVVGAVGVQYQKTLHTILDEGNFEIYPDLLAQKLVDLGYGTKYADNIALLRAAGGDADSWDSPSLVEYDEEGNKGKLKLTWGVAEQKEKLDAGEISQDEFDAFFYDAFEHATAGLLPLLTTLITNKAWTPAKVEKIATGNKSFISLDVALQLGSTANRGYANMLVPIYELLGVSYTPVSTIESSTYNSDVSYVLEQILAPVFTFLDTLGDKPVDTILGILPNLIYALAFRMAKPMLNMLNTTITYTASASLVGNVLSDGALIKVGDMLITNEEDALLPESMFAGGLNSVLEFFGLEIPAIDQATLATLGSLDKVPTGRAAYIYSGLEGTGKAYSITADKADVGYYLLSYILNVVKDETSFSSLLGVFMTQKDENGEAILGADGKALPDEEKIVEVKNVVYETLNLDEMNVGDVIAAIAELANQVEYKVGPYYWYDGSSSTPTPLTPAVQIYMDPENDWTEGKAQYLYENLETLLTSIFTMAGLDLDETTPEADGSVEAVLGTEINKLFTNETVTALAKLLGSLSDLNALLSNIGKEEGEETTPDANEPDTVAEGEEAEEAPLFDLNDLIKDELGIDLSVYEAYANLEEDAVIDFGVTDVDSFAAALVSLLNPLKPLLDFILAGKDITLINQAITLHGYKGYDNAIIPLLEALGCDVVAYSEGADTLALTINALVGLINKLTTNDPDVDYDGAIYTIIDILPGVLYYLSSNALSQGVKMLLTPVYAILDTIRPLFDINLAELLEGIEVDFDKDGVKEPLGIDLNNLNLNFVLDLVNRLAGLDLSALATVVYDACDIFGKEYNSKSTLESTFKKGMYSDDFTRADLLTVILSFVLEWATVPANAAKLDELLGTNGIIGSLNKVFEDVELTFGDPNWTYWFTTEEDFNSYVEGNLTLPNTLAMLTYPNDWTQDTAAYIVAELPELVDMIIALVNKDKADAAKTVNELLEGLLNEYLTADSLNQLVALIAGLLEDIDENLLDIAGYILDVNIVGLKSYVAPEIKATEDKTLVEAFAAELANVLDTYAGGLVDWLFFADDYRFAKKSDNTDTIVINGGPGYEKGLAIILEALGADAPAVADANVHNVFGALASRVDEILANPVNEILGLLPNLIYFLNANGAGVAINNLLLPVKALLNKLSAFGLNVNLDDIIKFKVKQADGSEIEYKLDLSKLSLANVVEIVETLTDLDLAVVEDILVNFCTGKIEKGTFGYRMVASKEDTVTILLTVALLFIQNEDNAAALNELIGTDIVSALKDVFASAPVVYQDPAWYALDWDDVDYKAQSIGVVQSALEYPNDWTAEKSQYLVDHLSDLVDTVITLIDINGVKYESLAALIEANVNIYTPDLLTTIQKALGDLIGGLDADLQDVVNVGLGAADKLLGADVKGLLEYDVSGVNDKESFVAALSGMLMEVEGLVEWLLLGKDYKLFVDDKNDNGEYDEGEDIITLNGARGYAEGLALILEALGIENLPAEDAETEEIVSGVLTAVFDLVDRVLADPVNEVIELLPNLIYFINANGVSAAVNNLAGAFNALALKLKAFGLNIALEDLLNIEELLNIDKDLSIGLDNFTLAAILELVQELTGLDLSKVADVFVGFALGRVYGYTGVNGKLNGRMVYDEGEEGKFARRDMMTLIVTAALRVVFDTEGNIEKLEEMLGTDIISAIKDVFAGGTITYTDINWDYALGDNGTVDTMKYSITYPNNWTEDTAMYVTEALPELGDLVASLIDKNYDSLSALLQDKVNVFTSENLQSIAGLITDLLKDIDDGLLEAAGVMLNADVVGLKKYTAPEGITTPKAFAKELANILNTYAPGVVEWLLLGKDYKFFVKDVQNDAPVDFITINGAHGYAEGLALLLEALGCEDLPTVYDGAYTTEQIVEGVLVSLGERIEEIFANPVEEVLNLLPNLLYFLNTNGVAAVIDNTLAALNALLGKLEAFGINVNINELVNLKKLMGIEDTDAAISLDNITIASLLEAVSYMVEGLDLTVIEDVLVNFALGKIDTYTSVSKEVGTPKKMSYASEFDKHDMVTVIANALLLAIADEDNKEFFIGLAGEDVYAVIVNLFNIEDVKAKIKDIPWILTDKVGTVFTVVDTSELYGSQLYGPLFTEEKANYIADNFGEFVDNIIYLLGIEINGVSIDSLTQLINAVLGGSLYNSDNVIAIRDALAGVLAGIEDLEVNGKNVGKHIAAVLKTSLKVDIAAVANVNVPTFSENKEQFVTSLCDVLAPLYPVLKWLLVNEDISFFVKEGKQNLITLPGAEGYAFGIIPLLEVLDCEGILTPAEYYSAVEGDASALLTSIINPVLARLDVIIENPAEEILSMLPNVIYFINSLGVDAVIKNTLNAVYTLLNAINPIVQIDLYELIGIDFSTLTFTEIFEKILALIYDATGYNFKNVIGVDSIAELTVGELKAYTSLNGKQAYRMEYAPEGGLEGGKAELVTVVLRLAVVFLMHENNAELLVGLLKDNFDMSADAEKYVRGVLDSVRAVPVETFIGMDQALAIIYYLFYGADLGVGGIAGGLKDINAAWQDILKELGKSDNPDEQTIGNILSEFLNEYMDDLLTDEGVAPNGLIAFFKKIVDWFNKIIEWFKNFFN